MTALTKPQAKAVFPPEVFARVDALLKRHHTRALSFQMHAHTEKLYLDEGCDYAVWYQHQWREVRMQSEFSLHAGGSWGGHQVGAEVPIPEGAWVIETDLFLGRYYIRVMHWGLRAIRAPVPA